MKDGLKTLVWRTALALVAVLLGWTLLYGPGQRAQAGPDDVEHVDHRNECIEGCTPAKHICCAGTESLRP